MFYTFKSYASSEKVFMFFVSWDPRHHEWGWEFFLSILFCLHLFCIQLVWYNASLQMAKLFAIWLSTSKSGKANKITVAEVLSLGKVVCAATGSNIEKIPASVYK